MLCSFVQGQNTLHLDSSGKVTVLPLLATSEISSNTDLTITVDKPEPQLEAMRQALLEKMRRTKANLAEENYTFRRFYDALWTPDVVDAILDELDQLIAYLEAPVAQNYTYQYLPSTSTYFNPIFLSWDDANYYTFNNRPLVTPFSLSAGDYYPVNKAFKLNVHYKDPYKDFLIQLYNASINEPTIQGLRHMSNTEFYRTLPKAFDSLKTNALALSKVPLESYTTRTTDSIDQLHSALVNNALYKMVSTSNFFKTWLWLYEGEITINPLEVRKNDTAIRSQNISLVEQLSKTKSLVNTLLIPVTEKDKKYLIYSAQPLPTVPDYTKRLKEPLTTDEQVAVILTNIGLHETVSVRQSKSVAIKDQNAFMDGVDTVATMIGNLVTTLKPGLGNWAKIFAAINPMEETHAIDGSVVTIPPIFDPSKSNLSAARNRQEVLAAIEKDLRTNNLYHPLFFQTITRTLESEGFSAINVTTEARKNNFWKRFLTEYLREIKVLTDRKEQLRTDSLIVTNLYHMLMRSNKPPQPITAGTDNSAPKYRTEIQFTKTTEDAERRYFNIIKYQKTAGRITDSSSIASFDYKVGKYTTFLTSAGIGFTIPNDYYGHNSVTTESNGAIKAGRKSETIRLVAGLHIYPWKIFLQDNKWGGSKKFPGWTRLSVFLGLGVPQPFQNYYPGISWDPVPGLKLIAGPQLYRHKRYKAENNVITEKPAVVKYAGTFFSINLDPAVVVKTLGFF